MDKILSACRWVYNKTVEIRKSSWESNRTHLRLYDTHNLLPTWKIENPELNVAYAQSLQETQKRVDAAYNGFFRRIRAGKNPGYPRFKGRNRYNSVTYPQAGFKLHHKCIFVSKIGSIKTKIHRPISGKLKTCTLHRTAAGDWFVIFACEVSQKLLQSTGTAIGVDVGINHFASLSNGEQIENPRFLRKSEKELSRTQRKLSKVLKEPKERERCRKIVAKVHKKIANRRSNFAHLISRELVDTNDFIAFENLDIPDMLQNHYLAKSISDVSWNQLISYTMYKAEEAGRRVALVDPRNTSKMCSRCGCLVEKDLSVRVHNCPRCGLVMDRDQNAAINILRLGLQSVGFNP